MKQIAYMGKYLIRDLYILKDNGDVYCRGGARVNLDTTVPGLKVADLS